MKNLEALRQFLSTRLKGSLLIIASNREPYVHTYEGGVLKGRRPPSGLVVALDPVMRILRGIWVASGQGPADREAADAQGRIQVPPDEPLYTLRRIWLTPEQEEGYYLGLANETLWPLCHIVHIRPTFRPSDWEHYKEVNRLFAQAILEEAKGRKALVWVQDFHLALCPRFLKRARPDLTVAHFWHIPWPNPEAFRICPWSHEILEGLLGADLLGFHIRYHCDNFLKTVAMEMEAKVIEEHSAVQFRRHTTRVRPFPISIDYEEVRLQIRRPEVREEMDRIRGLFPRPPEFLAVGVDRLDYTKGILERLSAIDRFLEKYPHYLGRFTYLGVGAPSRTRIQSYKQLAVEVRDRVQAVNWRHGSDEWQPVVFLEEQIPYPKVLAYYLMANLGIVSSLHDGMNLVAKEFVAAQTEEGPGVLLLSQFTGSARELHEALLFNPYDLEGFAEAIRRGLEMPEEERIRRMKWLQEWIREHDIYWWALSVIKEMARLRRA